MSGAAVNNGIDEIVGRILADADAEVRHVEKTAESAAQSDLEKAQEQAETVRREIHQKAEENAAKTHARETAVARTEARRIVLAAREEVAARALTQIRESLNLIRNDTAQYRASLVVLATEAVVALNEPEAVIRISKGDESAADAAFLEEVANAAGGHLGYVPRLSLEVAPDDLGGGCSAAAQGGRIVFDNTFRRRMDRAAGELRGSIFKEMMQDHG